MPWLAEFQFRAARYRFGRPRLNTKGAVSTGENRASVRGATDTEAYADAEAVEACSVLERGRGGIWLTAEVGWSEYPQAGLDGGTQNCVVNHKN